MVERRVTRLKHDLEDIKKDLEAVLNPKPCPAPKTSEDKKGDKGQRKESKTETGGPSGLNISIGIGLLLGMLMPVLGIAGAVVAVVVERRSRGHDDDA